MLERLASDLRMRPGRSRALGAILIGAALLACLGALNAFPKGSPDAWRPYLASMLLFAVGGFVLFPSHSDAPRPPRITVTVVVVGMCIVAIAGALRLYRLADLPFGIWRDEADIAGAASRVLNDPAYRPVFVPNNVHPLHLYAVIAAAFAIMGVTTEAIRTVMASFGIASVVAAFFLGRELYGNRFGLLLASFLAVSRWHLTFSRFGIPSVTAPFFELLTLWLLFRATRRATWLDYMLAGLSFGVGLNFYTGFRVFFVVVAVFAASRIVEWWRTGRQERGSRLRLLANWTGFALAAALAVAPFAQYALLNPEIVFGYPRDISIFYRRDEPNLAKALLKTTSEHLLMFNYRGDRNGRHNLPGEPMLDPVMGVLFVLGTGLAVRRVRLLPNALFATVLLAGLSAGIFALDFESPQANRAIGSIVGVLYMVALAAETLWRAFDHVQMARPIRHWIGALTAVSIGALLLYFNAYFYFARQTRNDAVWREFNGVETLAAHKMLEADPAKTTLYASMFLDNHEVVRFLAPQVASQAIVPPQGLPVHEPGDNPVALFVDVENTWILDEARRYYPNGRHQTYTTPRGEPALHTVVLSPDDIRSVQGLTARYRTGAAAEAGPAVVRTEKGIDAQWPEMAPLPPPFMAEWSGVLHAPRYGSYELVLTVPSRGSLWLDERQVLGGAGTLHTAVTLAQGNHALRMQAQSGQGPVRLQWQRPQDGTTNTIQAQWLYLSPPVTNNGLLGTYYGSQDWSGTAALVRVDPFLDMYFHLIPLPRPYSVIWAGQIEIPSDGQYTFGLRVHGKARVVVDDRLTVDAAGPADYVEGTKVPLTAGRHRIEVRYVDYLGSSRIHLYWTLPGSTLRQIVPTTVLWPTPALGR